jgi:amino acid adenylation domain-containing protein/thioester reductase-like protein
MSPARRTGATNLSFAQERMWFLEQMDDGSAAYNVSVATRLRGPLDARVLSRALDAVVARHSLLRVRFRSVGGVPRCEPTSAAQVPVARSRLVAAEGAREEALQEAIDREAALPFDLEEGPLLRARLLSLAPEEHVFCLTLHHLVADGESLRVLLEDLAGAYDCLVAGGELEAPPPAGDYLQLAAGERAAASAGAYDAGVAFWREALEGAEPLELPSDRRRMRLSRRGGGQLIARLPEEVARALEVVAREASVSLYLVLLTAFAVLLSRYSGQHDVVVGTPVANRGRSEQEGVVGLFVNTVAMRVKVDEDCSFRELLAQLRGPLLDALDHADVPFEHVVEELRPRRELGVNPLFQTMFALQGGEPAILRLDGLESTALDPRISAARFDLECTCWRESAALKLRLGYAGDLFEPASAQRIQRHLLQLLRRLAEDPQAPVAEVTMLAPADEEAVRVEGEALFCPALTSDFATLFEQQAGRTPDAPALIVGGRTLSYRELATRADRFAEQLRRRGIGVGEILGIRLGRSVDLVAAVLGAMKAGAAFLPLDPDEPDARVARMLMGAGVGWLVGKSPGGDAALPHLRSLRVDAAGEAEGPTAPPAARSADAAAYAIYTSGSSGSPKAVVVTHRNVVNTLVGCREWFGFRPDEVFLCLASHTFDIFYFELLSPLLCGGTAVLARREELLDPARLVPLVRRATVMQAVPGLMEEVIRALDAEGQKAERMRFAITGGDTVPASLPARMASVFPNGTPTVLYGPTEATMVCTGIQLEDPGGVEGHPIGRPLPNVEIRLCDERGRLVPVGVPGEIYVGGPGVAQGYLGGEGEGFLERGGRRFYRTGDVAKWLPSGCLAFLGRTDERVKVRGFRIEPAEVETALEETPGVGLARVVVPGSGDSRRLAAYLIPDSSGIDRAAAERARLDRWRELFDQTHSEELVRERDYTGWRSSYSGQAMAATAMDDWLRGSVAEIRAALPARPDGLRLLEVGAGTGLLVDELAGDAARYLATDTSAVLVERLRRRARAEGLRQVEARRLEAAELPSLQEDGFDAVILNSVSQYLPALAHLEQAVTAALRLLREGGVVFVGDVRSLPLWPTFLASLARCRGGAGSDPAAVRAEVFARSVKEQELLVDPRFFVSFEGASEVAGVDVLPRRGRIVNEMLKYRFNVVVRKGRPRPLEASRWLDWRAEGLSPERLGALLAEGGIERLGLRGVPHRLLAEDVAVRRWAWGEADRGDRDAAVAPEALREISRAHGYEGRCGGRGASPDGDFEVILHRPGDGEGRSWPAEPAEPAPRLANDPLLPVLEGQLRERAKAVVGERLPGYMVPASFHVVDRLPLRANEKLDREVLETAAEATPSPTGGTAPRTPTERLLARVWQEVLGIEGISRESNFFEVGGTSLRAIELAVRLRLESIRISAQDVFRHQTVAAMGKALDGGGAEPLPGESPPQIRTPPPPEGAHVAEARPPILRAEGVLLAGATGFLGIHLLRGLLARGRAVSCLVRGADDAEATARLRERWTWYFGDELPQGRVIAVAADLTQPGAGLRPVRWKALAGSADHVVNAAADVRHVAPGEALFQVNRDGVRRLLELTAAGAPACFHQISTIGVAGVRPGSGRYRFSERDFEVGQVPTEPYSASKLAAEGLVRDFFAAGGAGSIVRVGTLAPHSVTARFQKNASDHFLVRFLASTLKLGIAAERPERPFRLAPVDFVAEATLGLLALEDAPAHGTYHLLGPHRLTHAELLGVLHGLGYAVEVVPVEDFPRLALARAEAQGLERAIGGILPLIDQPAGTRAEIDERRTIGALARCGVLPPPTDTRWIEAFLWRLTRLGHLPEPPIPFPPIEIVDELEGVV